MSPLPLEGFRDSGGPIFLELLTPWDGFAGKVRAWKVERRLTRLSARLSGHNGVPSH